MNLAIIKFLWESKLIAIAPGWAAIGLIGYLEVFQLKPLQAEVTGVKDAVESLQQNQLEERLDSAYAALCMNPGDPALLERIRDLQQQYEIVVGRKYNPPSCDLLLKIK